MPLDVLINEQKAAPTREQKRWLKGGAQPENDLMTCNSKPILPKSLHISAALLSTGGGG